MNSIHETIGSITIKPLDNHCEIMVQMPIWTKKDGANKILIDMPLLGNLLTFAEKQEDVDQRVHEAITAFFKALFLTHTNLHDELKSMGWKPKKNVIKCLILE